MRETFSAWCGDSGDERNRAETEVRSPGSPGRYTVPWEKIDTGQMLVTVRELAQQAAVPSSASARSARALGPRFEVRRKGSEPGPSTLGSRTRCKPRQHS